MQTSTAQDGPIDWRARSVAERQHHQPDPGNFAVMEDLSVLCNAARGVLRALRAGSTPRSTPSILAAVALAVLCSVLTQYGVKFLVDTLSLPDRATAVWLAFGVLLALIAADNLLWRVASWVGNSTFVAVTGDGAARPVPPSDRPCRQLLRRALAGHLTSRITATSNALFTIENMLVWNVLPPCLATVCAIALVATVSWGMAAAWSWWPG